MADNKTTFTLIQHYEGNEAGSPEFSFHAANAQHAQSLAESWRRHHSLSFSRVTVRPATDHESIHWIDDSFVYHTDIVSFQVDPNNWEVWKGTRMVRIGGNANARQFVSVAYVDRGEVATTNSKTLTTLAGSIRWAQKWLSK